MQADFSYHHLLKICFSCGAVIENIFLVALSAVIIYCHYLLKYILVAMFGVIIYWLSCVRVRLYIIYWGR